MCHFTLGTSFLSFHGLVVSHMLYKDFKAVALKKSLLRLEGVFNAFYLPDIQDQAKASGLRKLAKAAFNTCQATPKPVNILKAELFKIR